MTPLQPARLAAALTAKAAARHQNESAAAYARTVVAPLSFDKPCPVQP